jgi:hypothetical protein
MKKPSLPKDFSRKIDDIIVTNPPTRNLVLTANKYLVSSHNPIQRILFHTELKYMSRRSYVSSSRGLVSQVKTPLNILFSRHINVSNLHENKPISYFSPRIVLMLWAENCWYSTSSGVIKTTEFLWYERLEVFRAVTMKNGVLWHVTPRGSCKNQCFGGT